jgi:tRNA U55 pseudouridine synthase TruB
MDTASLNRRIIPMARALDHLPGLTVNDAVLARVRFGQPLHRLLPPPVPTGKGDAHDAGSFVRLLDDQGRLAAVVAYDPRGDQYNYCCVFAD